jgi:hypothetical protein
LKPRMIRPDFWHDSKIVKLPVEARLLFIGIWTVADDHGYFEDDAEQLAIKLFPRDLELDVAAHLDRLLEAGLIRRWETDDGTTVLHVPNFHVHQSLKYRGKSRWADLTLYPSGLEEVSRISPRSPRTPPDSPDLEESSSSRGKSGAKRSKENSNHKKAPAEALKNAKARNGGDR